MIEIVASVAITTKMNHQYECLIAAAEYNATNSCVIQPVGPVLKVGNECPFGYNDGNRYCIPRLTDGSSKGIIPNYTNIPFKNCPLGFKLNRGYCQSTKKNKRYAIPKLTDSCPREYYPNGNFCIQICD